ncbi:TIGR03085 family metal-binding protein [Angustibacter sp. McL0619]|uniref:TIGR03085 family metal-binding protein n=1 Tax=Angustibacter sp. McL0619 TaxID=3415676 RepID=UPI003CE6E5D2
MSNHARAERAALCETLLLTGPSAPTLCEGWDTSDLAAHLVLRESRPDAQVGIYLPPLSGHATSVQQQLAALPWEQLVERLRGGPPVWNPMRWGVLDELTNTAEFFVHHEDVRRAQPGWEPRDLHPDLEAALWRNCAMTGRLGMRRADVGVELVATGLGRTTVKRGHPSVRVEGPAAELLLFCFGRRDVAQVSLDGPNEAVDALRQAPSGL